MNDRGLQAALETRALEEAATWYARLLPGAADLDDRNELAHAFSVWVAAAPIHDHAWKTVTAMSEHIAKVPPGIATPTLDRPGAKRRTSVLRSFMAVLAGGGTLLVLVHTAKPHLLSEHTSLAASELRETDYGTVEHPRNFPRGVIQVMPKMPVPCVFHP